MFILCDKGTMPRKRKRDGDGHELVPLKRPKCAPPQNRASPSLLLGACKDMSKQRKNAIEEMDFKSLRIIKCDQLFSALSEQLAGLYEPESREVVVRGRGRIPFNEESVYRVMGVPHGGENVPYSLPSEVNIEPWTELFGDLGYAPKMTELLELITGFVNFDTNFKRGLCLPVILSSH